MRALPPAVSDPSAEECSAAFQEFWKAFPRGRKRKKVEAWRLFFRIMRGRHRSLPRATPQELIAGALRHAAAMGNDHLYVQMPTSWLRGDGWQDEDVGEPAGCGAGAVGGFQRRLEDHSWAR